MCPVKNIAEGREGRVLRLLGCGNMARRLCEVGVYPGARIRVLRNQGGPVMLGVGDARFAVGRGIAEKILVSDEE